MNPAVRHQFADQGLYPAGGEKRPDATRSTKPMPSEKTTKITEQKQSYDTPHLVTYGRLKDITTGGSGANIESNGGKEQGKRP